MERRRGSHLRRRRAVGLVAIVTLAVALCATGFAAAEQVQVVDSRQLEASVRLASTDSSTSASTEAGVGESESASKEESASGTTSSDSATTGSSSSTGATGTRQRTGLEDMETYTLTRLQVAADKESYSRTSDRGPFWVR
jgi:cytoskeletal protein RodZ